MEEDEKIRKRLEEEAQRKESQNQNPTSQPNNNFPQTSSPKKGNNKYNQPNTKKDNSENKPTEPEDNSNPKSENKKPEPIENNNQSPTNPIPNQSNSKSKKENQIDAKQKLIQILKSNDLKTSDLPRKYQNWEKELEKLESEEKIKSYIQQLERAIKQQTTQKQLKTNQNKNPLSQKTKILYGIGISILTGTLLLSIIRKKIKKK